MVVEEDSDDDDEAIMLTRWRVATSSSSHVLLVTSLLPHGPEAELRVVVPLSTTRRDASSADRFIVVLVPMFTTPM